MRSHSKYELRDQDIPWKSRRKHLEKGWSTFFDAAILVQEPLGVGVAVEELYQFGEVVNRVPFFDQRSKRGGERLDNVRGGSETCKAVRRAIVEVIDEHDLIEEGVGLTE